MVLAADTSEEICSLTDPSHPDSFDRNVIWRVVHGFYERKEYPILSGVLKKVKEQCGFPGACGKS